MCALRQTLIHPGGTLVDRMQSRLFDGLVLHVNWPSFYKSDGLAMIRQIKVGESSGSPYRPVCTYRSVHTVLCPAIPQSSESLADSTEDTRRGGMCRGRPSSHHPRHPPLLVPVLHRPASLYPTTRDRSFQRGSQHARPPGAVRYSRWLAAYHRGNPQGRVEGGVGGRMRGAGEGSWSG